MLIPKPLRTHLQLKFQVVDVDVELEEVTIELVARKVQQVVGLALDVVDDVVQALDHLLQPLNVRVLLQSGELVNCREHVDELVQALGEEIKLEEDGGLVKVERLGLGLAQHRLGELVVLLVHCVQLDCHPHVCDEFGLVLVPQLPLVSDLIFALEDDLVGDLRSNTRYRVKVRSQELQGGLK